MNRRARPKRSRGFTLVEIMVVMAVATLVSAGVLAVFVQARKMWYPSSLTLSTNLRGGNAVGKMVYGVNSVSIGLRAASRQSVSQWSDGNSWVISYNTNQWVMYNGAQDTLSSSMHGLLCRGVVSSTATVSGASCQIEFAVAEGGGRYAVTNRFLTEVAFRN